MINQHLALQIYKEYKSKDDEEVILAIVNSLKYHEKLKKVAASGDDENSLYKFIKEKYLIELKKRLCDQYCKNKNVMDEFKQYGDQMENYFNFISSFCTILGSAVLGIEICQKEEAAYLLAIYYFTKLANGKIEEYCDCGH